MASYEKLTLDRFKIALKEGKYTGLTGARRAIGKTTSWSAKEKASAQELANKHFGEAPRALKPTAPKKASVKASSAKKSSAKAAGVKTSAPKKNAVRHAATPTVGSTAQPGSSGPTRAATAFDHRIAAHEALAFVHNARIELEGFKHLNKGLDTSSHEKELFQILENAINHMAASKQEGIPALAVSAVPRIEVPKDGVPPVRLVKNITDEPGVTSEQQPETVLEVSQNGTIEEEDLTDAERSARALLQGSASDLGLPQPRPSQV